MNNTMEFGLLLLLVIAFAAPLAMNVLGRYFDRSENDGENS